MREHLYIEKVANGWIVFDEYRRGEGFSTSEGSHMFETVTGLAAFIMDFYGKLATGDAK